MGLARWGERGAIIQKTRKKGTNLRGNDRDDGFHGEAPGGVFSDDLWARD